MRPRVAFLVNPAAARGHAKAVAAAVVERLRHGAEVELFPAGDDAASSLGALMVATASAPDAVVVCGGDGMVHLAANALVGGAIPLGVIPAGSGNDIADTIGIAADPLTAADQIGEALLRGSVRRIDVGRCDGPRLLSGVDRAFVGLLYAGFDAAVNQRANAMRLVPARARYNAALAIEALRLRARPMDISADEQTVAAPVTLVAVGNGPQYGGGKRIAPGARWDDGLFEVAVIGPVSLMTLARLAPTLPRGGHVGHRAAFFRAAAEVKLVAHGAMTAFADGELVGPLPMRAWVDPAALPVLVPAGR